MIAVLLSFGFGVIVGALVYGHRRYTAGMIYGAECERELWEDSAQSK